mgnify:CR=1 FL=1
MGNKNMNILDYFKNEQKYHNIIEAINNDTKNIQINNASSNASKMLVASSFLEKEQTIFAIGNIGGKGMEIVEYFRSKGERL